MIAAPSRNGSADLRAAQAEWQNLLAKTEHDKLAARSGATIAPSARVTQAVPALPALPSLPCEAFRREGNDALAVKYRPRTLEEVLGQPGVTDALKTFVADPTPCAMLFAGATGVGKTSAAHALARELGVNMEEEELGGFFEIPSGSQTTVEVRGLLDLLRYRPSFGSGWRVVVVNECDRMSAAAETLWLDALENLPPLSVIVFTTNDTSKLSRRFCDRCEQFLFSGNAGDLTPWIQALACRVWEREGGAGVPPGLSDLGAPGRDENEHVSFRLALQQLAKQVRRIGK